MQVSVAPLARSAIKFQGGIGPRNPGRRLHRLRRQQRPAQIGVQDDPRSIDDQPLIGRLLHPQLGIGRLQQPLHRRFRRPAC